MAIRYGMPVSEFLERHTSAELTELIAYHLLEQQGPNKGPIAKTDPEEQARLLKSALFKGT